MTTPNAALPHPRFRLPIVGDLLTVDLARPVQGLAKDIDTHGGIVEQQLFGWPGVIISRTDLVEEVNNESAWEKHVGHALRKLRPVAGDGLFTAYNHEPNWRKAHNILMPAFTKAAMESYHPSMITTVGELIDAWAVRASDGEWVDVPFEANRLTTEIVARTGFGHSFGKLGEDSDGPFIAAVLRELKYANRRTDTIPYYDKIVGRRRRRQHRQDKAYVREQVARIVDMRRANTDQSANYSDMLDIMLHAKDPETGETLDDSNIINQILTLLVAGSETSANAIAIALHYLARNPEIAAAARAEIDQKWPARMFPGITFNDVAKLRYLRRVVDETLRLWPVAPGYFRQAKVDTTIGGGEYTFKAGDWVFVLLLAAHRDPAWGVDAAEFNPDRFLPDNIRKLPPHVYKPFGTGARACIGRQFALHEIMLTLAAILHQFDFEPEAGYRLTVTETLTLKPAGLRLRLRPR